MYVTYLKDPELHANSYPSHPGLGETKLESQDNAQYWEDQKPWIRTVPTLYAPSWAIRQAHSTRFRYLLTIAETGYAPDGRRAALTSEEQKELNQLVDYMSGSKCTDHDHSRY